MIVKENRVCIARDHNDMLGSEPQSLILKNVEFDF